MSRKKNDKKNEPSKIRIVIILALVWCAGMLTDYIFMPDTRYLPTATNDHGSAVIYENEIDVNSPVKVHVIDVGQGDAILIETDWGHMLIDAGERDKGSVVVDYIKSLGISHLAYVVGTHPHSDHIGGLSEVILTFDIGNMILPDVEHTTATFERMIDAIIEKDLTVTTPIRGETFSLGDVLFTVIAPTQKTYENLNNYSVSLRMDYAGSAFIFTGDAEELSEKEMVASGINLRADVLKVGHHGSRTSTQQIFLDAVQPRVAVISLGEDNTYGHPHTQVLSRLAEANILVYRTDQDGTIVIQVDSAGQLTLP